jgi:hypothetical protein
MINDATDDQDTRCTCGHSAMVHTHVLTREEYCGHEGCRCPEFTRAPGQPVSAWSFLKQRRVVERPRHVLLDHDVSHVLVLYCQGCGRSDTARGEIQPCLSCAGLFFASTPPAPPEPEPPEPPAWFTRPGETQRRPLREASDEEFAWIIECYQRRVEATR